MTGHGRLKTWEWWCIALTALFGLFRLSHGSWSPGLQTIGLAIIFVFLLRRRQGDKASSDTPKLFPD